MSETEKTVFISYRRDVSSFIARAVFMDLRAHGYDVFMDIESIDSGTFDTVILNQITARAHFLLILTPGSLERCNEPGDWLRREIEHAMDLQRNIVPLMINNFTFKGMDANLTGKLVQLRRYNALNVPHEYFDEAMERLRARFLKQPVYGKVVPAPSAEGQVVQQKIEEVASQPVPTPQELGAEALLKQGNVLFNNGDYAGAIRQYDQAIRLNPDFASLYFNRGFAYHEQGNYAQAVVDLSEAIRLDPHSMDAHFRRGRARAEEGDVEGAIEDYSEVLRLNPQYSKALWGRGNILFEMQDWEGAAADYSAYIALVPEDAAAYNNRAEAHFALGMYEQALRDFEKGRELNPESHFAMAGMAITLHALGQLEAAKNLWYSLISQDEDYSDIDWTKAKLSWSEAMTAEARKLIVRLSVDS